MTRAGKTPGTGGQPGPRKTRGLLTILDVKRGDVGSTNGAYAQAFPGAGAPLEADAVTVHPYLGPAAMDAFVSRADKAGACLLVVTRSSNPEGRAVQAARDHRGRCVAEALLSEIGALNWALAPGEIGPVGAVICPSPHSPRRTAPRRTAPHRLGRRCDSLPETVSGKVLTYKLRVRCADHYEGAEVVS